MKIQAASALPARSERSDHSIGLPPHFEVGYRCQGSPAGPWLPWMQTSVLPKPHHGDIVVRHGVAHDRTPTWLFRCAARVPHAKSPMSGASSASKRPRTLAPFLTSRLDQLRLGGPDGHVPPFIQNRRDVEPVPQVAHIGPSIRQKRSVQRPKFPH